MYTLFLKCSSQKFEFIFGFWEDREQRITGVGKTKLAKGSLCTCPSLSMVAINYVGNEQDHINKDQLTIIFGWFCHGGSSKLPPESHQALRVLGTTHPSHILQITFSLTELFCYSVPSVFTVSLVPIHNTIHNGISSLE